MSLATLTSKGQITLPKDIRDRLNLSAGDQIDFVMGEGKEIRLLPRNKSLWDLKGKLKQPGRKPVTLAEMKDSIARGAARKP